MIFGYRQNRVELYTLFGVESTRQRTLSHTSDTLPQSDLITLKSISEQLPVTTAYWTLNTVQGENRE